MIENKIHKTSFSKTLAKILQELNRNLHKKPTGKLNKQLINA